eukprot:CAMPEP_0202868214 /NCGR_PEP_ID=MMETSP1391-20130828/10466_1 /ASSEMBLY_ACC=CAM_ASM_000867 /TAXON_ID=1034604 /ORGANISM="Chlamydomonas leiostraca, Strain SAG 11-49" /LENGTH=65 /DNA_ID=CAMNT_0049548349 /DNA_START=481 /DNA_END=678 /DNA_ORIENTATION=-
MPISSTSCQCYCAPVARLGMACAKPLLMQGPQHATCEGPEHPATQDSVAGSCLQLAAKAVTTWCG